MENTRTLVNLRNSLKGRVYIYLKNEAVCQKLLQNAKEEGYRFGEREIDSTDGARIIALEAKRQLGYVGFVGHLAFQCNGGDGNTEFYRVDYNKYIRGYKDFYYKAR